jgi:threonine/homoserine efflux transporter RhtA
VRNWLLGAVTLWLPLFTVYFLVFVVPQTLLLAMLGTMLLLVAALLVIYLVDAHRNRRVPDARRSSWAIALVMASVVTMPVYWWLYLRPTGRTAASAGD